MSISLVLASLRRALPILPVEWALWSLDGEGVFRAHEGPGAARAGSGRMVGRRVRAAYRGEEAILGFAARVLLEPSAEELVAGGLRIHLAGAPVAEGGAVGMALVLGPASERGPSSGLALPPAVLELLRPVPEIGGEAGDLLLWNAERPEAVGLYREVAASRLPRPVARDLSLTRSSAAGGSLPPAPAPGGASRPLRERASHLRVVS